MDMKIVLLVLPYGHVLVGELEDGSQNRLKPGCAVVRRWGTNSGLGQLANEGPRENTKLDKIFNAVEFGSPVFSIACNMETWKSHLGV